MKYLYTTEPDEGCREIRGVYGRPVHTHEQSALKAKGWKENPDELRQERREKEEVNGETPIERVMTDAEFEGDLAALYEEVMGKRPHHKMRVDTMRKKIDEALSDD